MSGLHQYEKGMKFLEEIDPGATDIVNGLRQLGPDLVEMLVGSLYGNVYPRPGLDLKTRLLVTVACVAAMGDSAPQVKYQSSLALKQGVSIDELREVLLQVAVFSGFTRAINASQALQSVIKSAETDKS